MGGIGNCSSRKAALDSAHQIFVVPEGESSFLYCVNCPECGAVCTVMEAVSVRQDGADTLVTRGGDTVSECDTTELPGALVGLSFVCSEGHRFALGFLQCLAGTRVYAGIADLRGRGETLWVNENFPEQEE